MSIAIKLAEERRARLAAERLLELKQAELFAANRKLAAMRRRLAKKLSKPAPKSPTCATKTKR